MLRTLRIKDFAIVDSLEIAGEAGLTVFTGETGAGKTIIVEAIRFLLGGKVGPEMVRTGADQAVVEAQFDPVRVESTDEIAAVVANGSFWVRRELSAQGTSRAFLNDRQITRAQLQSLGERLADLCGQHQHQVLLDPTRHVEWLDHFAGCADIAAGLRQLWSELTSAKRTQAASKARLERQRSQDELRRFQITEIRAANVRADEEEALKSEIGILKNARRLAEGADAALAALTEDDRAVETVLGRLRRDADNLAAIDPRWNEIIPLLTTASESSAEAARALAAYRDHLSFEDQRLDQIEVRLTELYRLKGKYGGSCKAILEHLARLEAEQDSDTALAAEIASLGRRIVALEQSVVSVAGELSHQRRSAAARLERSINAAIVKLGMTGARVQAEFTDLDEGGVEIIAGDHSIRVGENGAETVRFLFEANPREGFKPLDKIASGGELSRLLLAFKSATSSDRAMLTIFDEIDAGLGGQTAHAVARQIKALAAKSQVFLISHLQQLASVADVHYQITKKTVSGRARVSVGRLEGDDRVRELARMVAGDQITNRTLDFAAELTRRK